MKYILPAIFCTLLCLGAAAQIPFEIDTTGLLAWYPFSGNLDNTYNGPTNNGVGYGTIRYDIYRSGNINQSYISNGTNGIDIPANNFPTGNAARSVCVSYKNAYPYTPGLRQLIAWGNDGAAGQLFGIAQTDTSMRVDFMNGAVYTKVTPDSLWHNVIVTYPASGAGPASVKLYIDGILSSTEIEGSLTALATDTGHVHYIGTLSPATNQYSWLGNIDEVGIWNRELTHCEVRVAAKCYRVELDSIPDSCQKASGALKAYVIGGAAPFHYVWSATNSIDSNSIDGLSSGLYSVAVTDASGCVAHGRMNVPWTCSDIEVAEGMSPNGDGLNDYWVISWIDLYPNNMVQVYDKWGSLVYEQSNYKNDWDGKSKGGARLPDGVYFYLVKLNAPAFGNRKNEYTGQLLIRR